MTWGRESDFDWSSRDVKIASKGGRLLKSVSKNRHSNTVRGCVVVMRTSANADVPLSELVAEARRKAARGRTIRAQESRKHCAKLKICEDSSAKQRPAKVPKPLSRFVNQLKTRQQLIRSRSSAVVLSRLGNWSRARPEKVEYRKRPSVSTIQTVACELRIRISGEWFSVDELLSVGFLDQRFAQYSGLIAEKLASAGRLELAKHFQIGKLRSSARAPTSKTA